MRKVLTQGKDWLVVRDEASAPHAEILVHGYIGNDPWDESAVSGRKFTEALNSIPAGRKVVVGVDSLGGNVHDGFAIFNAIARRRSDVTVRVDGFAASIASFFPLAASKVVTYRNTQWFLHQPWAPFVSGNARELREIANALEKKGVQMAETYSERMGISVEEAIEILDNNTWYTGEEAVEAGLADEVIDGEAVLVAVPHDAPYLQFLPAALRHTLTSKTIATRPVSAAGSSHTITPKSSRIMPENKSIDALEAENKSLAGRLADALEENKLLKDNLAKARAAIEERDAEIGNLRRAGAESAVDAVIASGRFAAESRDALIDIYLANPEAARLAFDKATPAKPDGAAEPVKPAKALETDEVGGRRKTAQEVWAAQFKRN